VSNSSIYEAVLYLIILYLIIKIIFKHLLLYEYLFKTGKLIPIQHMGVAREV